MNEEEDFDGSALRELLTPMVDERGRTAAPADAIVAAGRRRVVGRRVAVAGGALALVAGAPLAATAIAAGPGRTAATTADASSHGTGTPTHAAGPAPGPASSPAPARTSAPSAVSKWDPTYTPHPISPDAPLPTRPVLLGSGTLDGRHWEISGVGSAGNNALTARDQCLKLLISEDGRATDPALGEHILYCLPGVAEGYQLEELAYSIKNGAGSLEVGTVSADVAKIVAHVDGVPAPVTVATVAAPGVAGTAIYIVPVPGNDAVNTVFDEYNAAGAKIGSFDNTTPMGTR